MTTNAIKYILNDAKERLDKLLYNEVMFIYIKTEYHDYELDIRDFVEKGILNEELKLLIVPCDFGSNALHYFDIESIISIDV